MDSATKQPLLDTRWKSGVLLAWLVIGMAMIVLKLPDIAALSLGDTDDNLRLAQIRALLDGQSWYDLRQYRLAPPGGADLHWSRIPDLPIVGLILLLTPFLGAALAEQWAVALAPLLPLGIGLFALSLVVRRIVSPSAWPLAILAVLLAIPVIRMWMPLRIDHHGWQLALLALAIAGLVDARKGRGGVVCGIATVVSFAIGLEMLAFLALIGGMIVLGWVRDGGESRRMAGYGGALGGGVAILFLVFASQANRMPVCDALSPVWLSVVAVAGGLLVLMASFSLASPQRRLLTASIAGAVILAGFALIWPACLGRPENISPELQRLWLDEVGEAKPLLSQGWRSILAIAALPITGLTGYLLLLRRAEAGNDRLAILGAALVALAGFSLLFWQIRFAPAALLLAIPGGVGLGMILLARVRASNMMFIRTIGAFAVLLVMTASWTALPFALFPKPADADHPQNRASARACLTQEALAPIAALPRGTILAPIDLSPRLIVMTPHDAIAGPYHRNGDAMLDIIHGFGGDEGRARETVDRYDVGYVLICPGLAEERLYDLASDGESGGGFYDILLADRATDWLEPMELPADSPFRMWRVR